jgi:hypothetical protein
VPDPKTKTPEGLHCAKFYANWDTFARSVSGMPKSGGLGFANCEGLVSLISRTAGPVMYPDRDSNLL